MVRMTNGATTSCQRFVQNAWKKDLCSNCFKSKEDHISASDKKPAYNWKLYLQSSPKHGILKDATRCPSSTNGQTRTNNVSFRSEESTVIGYGGDDFSSDEDDNDNDNEFEDYYDDVEIRDNDDTTALAKNNSSSSVQENDEERQELLKLTQSNTDFNSDPANLLAIVVKPAPPPLSSSLNTSVTSSGSKSYSNLKLGKPLVDANGHRQTLKVSVEPFRASLSPPTSVNNSTTISSAGCNNNNGNYNNGFDINSRAKNSVNNNSNGNILNTNFRKIPKISVVRDDCRSESPTTTIVKSASSQHTNSPTTVVMTSATVTNNNNNNNNNNASRLNKKFKEEDHRFNNNSNTNNSNNNNNNNSEDGTARRRQIVPPKNIEESETSAKCELNVSSHSRRVVNNVSKDKSMMNNEQASSTLLSDSSNVSAATIAIGGRNGIISPTSTSPGFKSKISNFNSNADQSKTSCDIIIKSKNSSYAEDREIVVVDSSTAFDSSKSNNSIVNDDASSTGSCSGRFISSKFSDKRKRKDSVDELTIEDVSNCVQQDSPAGGELPIRDDNNNNYSSKELTSCIKNDVKANIRNAKTKLEPLFRTNMMATGKLSVAATFENGLYTTSSCSNSLSKLPVSSDSSNKSSSIQSPFTNKLLRDYNNSCDRDQQQQQTKPNEGGILNLPLIASSTTSLNLKDFELLELDQPGSRELVGEPDGKADSDDTSDPPSLRAADSTAELLLSDLDVSLFLNPQRSFLHGFTKEKPKLAAKPCGALLLQQHGGGGSPPSKKTTTLESPHNENDQKSRTPVTSTPNSKHSSKFPSNETENISSSDTARSSTKRHAPPPPLSLVSSVTETDPSTATTAASNGTTTPLTRYFQNENEPSSKQDCATVASSIDERIKANKDCSSSSSSAKDTAATNNSEFRNQQQLSTTTTTTTAARTPLPKPRVFLYEKYVKRNSEDYTGSPTRQQQQYKSGSKSNSIGGGTAISSFSDDVAAKETNDDSFSHGGISERTSLSLSCDSVATSSSMTGDSSGQCFSERSKRYNGAATKVRYTLRRILRFSKDDRSEVAAETVPSPINPTTPKKKLEIIHPLDLNKSAVQVVKGGDCVRLNMDYYLTKKLYEESKLEPNPPSGGNTNNGVHSSSNSGRPSKPPPPPRSQSLDFCSKPMRPPPPKTTQQQILKRDCTSSTELVAANSNNVDNTNTGNNGHHNDDKNIDFGTDITTAPDKSTKKVYENLGESRQSLVPVKPHRSSSIRDKAKLANDETRKSSKLTDNNEPSEIEAVPECDRNSAILQTTLVNDGIDNIEIENSQTPSMVYCSSETESDIYYQSIVPPSSGHESILSNGDDSSTTNGHLTNWKNRAVLHNSLEDNYGAVIVANHEALSQLLEQVDHAMIIPSSVRTFQTQHATDMRWKDFEIFESSRVNMIDCKFYNAKWKNSIPVIISVSFRRRRSVRSLPTWITLTPVIEFTDRIPSRYFKDPYTDESAQAYVTVWSEEKMESILSYSSNSCTTDDIADIRKAAFVIVQLTYALKCLQACGIEEVSLDEFIICREEEADDTIPRLCLLPSVADSSISPNTQCGQNKLLSLCKCTRFALTVLLPNHKLTKIMQQILNDERATSLSQAKVVVEYWLWGPGDVNLSNDKLTALQRWLDLERATLLHKLVCSRSLQLSTVQRYQLMFLVRTNARMLSEAALFDVN